jgi:hypothetical protein
MRKNKKVSAEGKAQAKESQRKKTTRSKVGTALEKTMLTETGRKVARKIGGNPEPKKTGAGFGGSMSIPKAGGTTERVHGSGYDKHTRMMKPLKRKTKINKSGNKENT